MPLAGRPLPLQSAADSSKETPVRALAFLSPGRLALAAAVAWALGAGAAAAQTVAAPARVYPMGSQVGYASFGAGPTLTVNCVSYPLGPGLRVLTAGRHLLLRN